jgi:hypothetical protein
MRRSFCAQKSVLSDSRATKHFQSKKKFCEGVLSLFMTLKKVERNVISSKNLLEIDVRSSRKILEVNARSSRNFFGNHGAIFQKKSD